MSQQKSLGRDDYVVLSLCRSGFPQVSMKYCGYAAAEAKPPNLERLPGKPEAFRTDSGKAALPRSENLLLARTKPVDRG